MKKIDIDKLEKDLGRGCITVLLALDDGRRRNEVVIRKEHACTFNNFQYLMGWPHGFLEPRSLDGDVTKRSGVVGRYPRTTEWKITAKGKTAAKALRAADWDLV